MPQNSLDSCLNICYPNIANNVTKLINNVSVGSELAIFQVYFNIKLKGIILEICSIQGHLFPHHFP